MNAPATIAVSTATGPELLAFFNAHSPTPTKRFADLATARRRVSALLATLPAAKTEPAPAPKKAKKAASPFPGVAEEKPAKSLRAALAAKAGDTKPNTGKAGGYVVGTCPHCGATSGITLGSAVREDGEKIAGDHVAQCGACRFVFNANSGKNIGSASSSSVAVAESWKDGEVAAARATRHGVLVDKVEYPSVKAAFIELGLPLGTHIRFRLELKACTKLTDKDGRKWSLVEKK